MSARADISIGDSGDGDEEDVDFCTPSLHLKAPYKEETEIIRYTGENGGSCRALREDQMHMNRRVTGRVRERRMKQN